MDLIPIEEKSTWNNDLKPILNEMAKLSDADKIQGFRNEVVERYVAYKALNYVSDQLFLVECDRELLEKENEELNYKIDNLGNYDENRLQEFKNKTVIVPTSNAEKKDMANKIFMRNRLKMKRLNSALEAPR
jgi:hypothetical protein